MSSVEVERDALAQACREVEDLSFGAGAGQVAVVERNDRCRPLDFGELGPLRGVGALCHEVGGEVASGSADAGDVGGLAHGALDTCPGGVDGLPLVGGLLGSSVGQGLVLLAGRMVR